MEVCIVKITAPDPENRASKVQPYFKHIGEGDGFRRSRWKSGTTRILVKDCSTSGWWIQDVGRIVEEIGLSDQVALRKEPERRSRGAAFGSHGYGS